MGAPRRRRCDKCGHLRDVDQVERFSRRYTDAQGNTRVGRLCAPCLPEDVRAAAEANRERTAQLKAARAKAVEEQQAAYAEMLRVQTEREAIAAIAAIPRMYKEAAAAAAVAALPKRDQENLATMLRVGETDYNPQTPGNVLRRYDSIAEFIDTLSAPTACDGTSRYSLPHDQRRAKLAAQGHDLGPAWEGFSKITSWAEATAFWFGGWPQGVERLRDALDQVEPPETQDIRRRAAWADTGTELSTDRLWAGDYERAWRTTRRRKVFAPTRVRIVVDIGSSCGACNMLTHDAQIVAPETLFWRGAAACSLAESLEHAGFRVEIIVAGAANELGYNGIPDPILAAAVTVKSFTENLDLATVAATTASSSFFRRAFLMWELTHVLEPLHHCYGNLLRVENMPAARAELGLDEPGVSTLYVSDYVLTAPLANAWARGSHAGLESVNGPVDADQEEDPDAAEE